MYQTSDLLPHIPLNALWAITDLHNHTHDLESIMGLRKLELEKIVITCSIKDTLSLSVSNRGEQEG
jgi:hypothetical protein